MLSEVRFASFADYSSRGTTAPSDSSRKLCGALKAGNSNVLTSLVTRLGEPAAEPIRPFLADDRVLVPVPGSGRTQAGNLWVPLLVCEALRGAGFGREVQKLVTRERAVPKSAFAAPGERPTVQTHYDSFAVHTDLYVPQKITLVDDVLTKGSTTMGAYRRLRDAFPQSDIAVFAVFRTCNLQAEIASVVAPRVGQLRYQHQTDQVTRID